MDAEERATVWERAGARCEYCHGRERAGSGLRFHVEHIVARQHRGDDTLDNLALACHLCNAHKGPNLAGMDPDTAVLVPLFHPRRNRWDDHFEEVAGEILGLTPVGRASVAVLGKNHPARIALRMSAGDSAA